MVVETSLRVAAGAMRQNEARLLFLDALGKETARSNDADTIMAITTRMIGEYLNVAICAYADMDADQDGFTIRGDWSAPGSPSIVGHYSLADFGKLAVRNLGAGRPLVERQSAGTGAGGSGDVSGHRHRRNHLHAAGEGGPPDCADGHPRQGARLDR